MGESTGTKPIAGGGILAILEPAHGVSLGHLLVDLLRVFPHLLIGVKSRNALEIGLFDKPQVGHFLNGLAALLAVQHEVRTLLLQRLL